MESGDTPPNKALARRIRVQAILWMTELHGPGRNAALEETVRRWIAEDPRHAAAFESATEVWQESGDLPAHIPQATLDAARRRSGSRLIGPAIAAAAVLCGLLIATVFYLRSPALVTGAGEQRTIELSDGTQVTLNANTRLRLQYDAGTRKVTLARGEAFFHVAKQALRPFVVIAGNRKVIAVGTSFLIRREDPEGSAFAVTLVEGRVAVEPIAGPNVLPTEYPPTVASVVAPAPSGVATAGFGAGNVPGMRLLRRGERLRYADDTDGTLDSPSIDKVTAWQRGLLIFDDTTLADAAAEFNRYGATKITVAGAAGSLRVGGVYRISDASSFAQAMAIAYHLHIDHRDQEIILSDKQTDLR